VPSPPGVAGRGKLKGLWANEDQALAYMAARDPKEVAGWKLISFDDGQNLNGKIGPVREKMAKAAAEAAAARAGKPGAGETVSLKADNIESKSSGKLSRRPR